MKNKLLNRMDIAREAFKIQPLPMPAAGIFYYKYKRREASNEPNEEFEEIAPGVFAPVEYL